MKLSSTKGWAAFFAGLALVGSALYFNFRKEDNLGKEFQRPSSAVQLVDKTYTVPLKEDTGFSLSENLRVTVEFDSKTNTIFFGNYTQNFDKTDWSEIEKKRTPINKRHTSLNPVYSQMFVLHFPKVNVSGIGQRAFLVPQYGWDQNLKPFEKHKEAQMAIEGGEKIIDFVAGKIPIPFFNEFMDKGLKNATAKEKRRYKELANKLKEGYTATIIPSYIPNKIVGSTETAREYQITFDTNNLEGKTQAYLWARVALGNSSPSSDNEFPNKYGELENVVVEFELKKGVKKKVVVEDKNTNSLGMEFVYIKSGTFMMGSPPSESRYRYNEDQHQVILTKGFYMQTTELTQEQWRAVMGNNPSASSECGDGCPVVRVSWNDVQEFIRKLNQQEGGNLYRLPTEAEWEYAARAGSKKAFANGRMWGDGLRSSNLDAMGWYKYNRKHNGKYGIKKVAQKQPNKWGLYDMHGNVSEWCQDNCESRDKNHFVTNTYKNNIVDPLSKKGSFRIYRGGAIPHIASSCRSARKGSGPPNLRDEYIGFRLVKNP